MKHTDKFKMITLGSAALIGSLVLTGCGADSGDKGSETPAQSSSVTPENASTAKTTDDPQDGKASASPADSSAAQDSGADGGKDASIAAVKTALSKYKDGDVKDLDYDEKKNEFDAEVISGDKEYEVIVDGAGKNVVREKEDGSADKDDVADLGKASIDAEQALERAFKEAESQSGDRVLDDISLDEDNGAVRWEVELKIDGKDAKYYVDATSGAVTQK